MSFPIKTVITLVLIIAAAIFGYKPVKDFWTWRNRPNYRFAEVSSGAITAFVDATGTVEPVLSVSVGSFVSGPIDGLYVDFNDRVTKGKLLAKIDPTIYQASVDRDEALLATQKAGVTRAEAQLQQAKNDEARAQALRKENKEFVSDTEMDQLKFNRLSLEAQLVVAQASVKQAEANLKNSRTNLGYTEIRSPVDGVVIDRKIDEGQTLAAQFQTPELFIVAPDLKTKMHIVASVDESDIGLIRQAQSQELPVKFTVDAYPDDLFTGKVEQIRMNSATAETVVTYPVVVAAPNPDLKLLPGMTANLSFQIDERKEALRIPNAALRFYPQRELVRPEDRPLLEGVTRNVGAEEETEVETQQSAVEKSEARRNRNRRHVWVEDGYFLKAVEVHTGISNHKYTVLSKGELEKGQKLVTGIRRED